MHINGYYHSEAQLGKNKGKGMLVASSKRNRQRQKIVSFGRCNMRVGGNAGGVVILLYPLAQALLMLTGC